MANYETLKAAINAVIKANGNKEITGTVLNETLTAMVNSLGANYQFAGVATPSTNPGTPDQNVFYLAGKAGTYTNFNSTVLPNGLSILKWNGNWSGETVLAGDGVFDISAYKATGGTLATFADLSAALDGGNNIPSALRKGGMSVKFIQGSAQSSDNKYVQYRLMTDSFSTIVTYWQKMDTDSLQSYLLNQIESDVAEQVDFNRNLNDGFWQNNFVENGNISYYAANFACTRNLIPVHSGGLLTMDVSVVQNFNASWIYFFAGTSFLSAIGFNPTTEVTVPDTATQARILIQFTQNTEAASIPRFPIYIDKIKTSKEKMSDLYGDTLNVDSQKAMLNGYSFAKGMYASRIIPNGSDLGMVFGFADVAVLRFDILGVSELNVSIETLPYHGIYAITDEENVVLSSEVAQGASTYTNKFKKADFPTGAKFIYFCSSSLNLESAYFSIRFDDYGLVHQDGVLSEIVDNTLYKTSQLSNYTIWNYVWANVGAGWTRLQNNNSFVYNVKGVDIVSISLIRPENEYFAFVSIIKEDGTFIHFTEAGGEATITKKITLPENSKFLVVYHYKTQLASTVSVTAYTKNDAVDEQTISKNTQELYGHWSGKDFVWFGTSIPAGDNNNKYPQMVGDILGSHVYNEAVGSSPAHCRQKNLVSETNPYGFISNFSAVSRCLSNSLEEMQWVIEHWNSGVFTVEVPTEMTEALAASILNNSYERKLLKYFDQEQFYRVPELIVMNHGYNDIMDYEDTDYKTPFEITGGEPIEGGYQYHSGDAAPSVVGGAYRIEYDVTGLDSVEINSSISVYLDIWDLFDGNTFVQSSGMTYGTGKNKTVIKVGSATKLVLTIPNGVNPESISVYDYAYFTDRFTYNGAMNFLFTQIKSRCPKTRIVMIGEYANETKDLVALNQEKVADRWDIPLYEQWRMLQMSSNFIWTTYGWSNGQFKPGVYPDGHYMKEIDMYLPDGVHPHSDGTKQVNKYMAQNMAKWIDNIYPFEYNQ